MLIGRYFAKKNAAHNRNIEIRGYIRSQRDEPAASMKYGCSTVAKCGCEAIACYHALLSLGRERPLCKVMEVTSACGLLLFGLWGTDPHALPRICKRLGLRYRRYRRRHFSEISENVVLYAYWNPRFRGIHTVELHRTPLGVVVTNLGALRYRTFPTMEEALSAIDTPRTILCLGIA